MGLFGSKGKHAEEEGAGRVEVERLTALPAQGLAVELLPAFGADGARSKGKEGTPPMQIVQWLVRRHPDPPGLQPPPASTLPGLAALLPARPRRPRRPRPRAGTGVVLTPP